MSLADNLTNKEETIESPSQRNVRCTADQERSENLSKPLSGNVPAAASDDTLIFTPFLDAQILPAPSAIIPDAFDEPKQAFSNEENSFRLRLLESELDDVRREIDAKHTRRAELETLIELMKLFPDSVLSNDKDTQTEQIDFNHSPDYHESTLSPTVKASEGYEIPQMPIIIESSEAFDDFDVQSSEIRAPNETASKRVRWDRSAPFKVDNSSNIFPPKFVPDSEAAFTQAWLKPAMFKNRNRLSRILLGQLSALQVDSQEIEEIHIGGTSKNPTDPYRPASYPRTQRWRKSIGVSVKALREGFERLSLVRREERDS